MRRNQKSRSSATIQWAVLPWTLVLGCLYATLSGCNTQDEFRSTIVVRNGADDLTIGKHLESHGSLPPEFVKSAKKKEIVVGMQTDLVKVICGDALSVKADGPWFLERQFKDQTLLSPNPQYDSRNVFLYNNMDDTILEAIIIRGEFTLYP